MRNGFIIPVLFIIAAAAIVAGRTGTTAGDAAESEAVVTQTNAASETQAEWTTTSIDYEAPEYSSMLGLAEP